MKDSSKKIISTIISKTLIFVFVVLLIGMFKSIFGKENSLVGVTSVVLMLALLQKNLTHKPIKNLVQLVVFNIILGAGAYIANQNIWAGLLVNFSLMCSIGYLFSDELTHSLNMLFGLHYILMLTNPISVEQLPMRLVSLVFAACMIMAAQLLANKNKYIENSEKMLNIKSNRIAYGIRLGLLVATASFITNSFNLEFGNWMVYTVFALTQPYSEHTKEKSKKRVIGTIVGAIIVFILFNIIKEPGARSIILVATGYIMSYVSDYKHVVIFITISSICSAIINIPNPNLIIINRLLFVGIGVIMSLLANRFILERKYEDEENKLNNIKGQIPSF